MNSYSSCQTENSIERGSSWQWNYVLAHIESGHCGLCYAWLDTAFCPLQFMFGTCQYDHSCPSSWSTLQKSEHNEKLLLVNTMWQNVNPAEFLGNSLGSQKKRRYQKTKDLASTKGATKRLKKLKLIKLKLLPTI